MPDIQISCKKVKTDTKSYHQLITELSGVPPKLLSDTLNLLLFFQPNMDKYRVVTYEPADKGSWVDSAFIHNQHGTFTNQVLNEFA